MLTAKQIEDAKALVRYSHPTEVFHEHDDCIRIAYEWLDAQNTIATTNKAYRPLKHIIEEWAGRYVSQSDVEVAAFLHSRISGKYPNFNLSARLTLPSDRRLKEIGEAMTQDYREDFQLKTYVARRDG